MKILMSKTETSKSVSLSPSTISRMIADDRFPKSVKIGDRVMWRVKDLEEWAEKLANNEIPEPPKKRGRKRLSAVVA